MANITQIALKLIEQYQRLQPEQCTLCGGSMAFAGQEGFSERWSCKAGCNRALTDRFVTRVADAKVVKLANYVLEREKQGSLFD